jgi:hypothetical protein
LITTALLVGSYILYKTVKKWKTLII